MIAFYLLALSALGIESRHVSVASSTARLPRASRVIGRSRIWGGGAAHAGYHSTCRRRGQLISRPALNEDKGGETLIERDNLNSTYYEGFLTSPLNQPRSAERESLMMKSTLKFVGGSAVVIVALTVALLAADGVFKIPGGN